MIRVVCFCHRISNACKFSLINSPLEVNVDVRIMFTSLISSTLFEISLFSILSNNIASSNGLEVIFKIRKFNV
ncbi:unnamed protein product, partial [Rotaria sp. Silwood2]